MDVDYCGQQAWFKLYPSGLRHRVQCDRPCLALDMTGAEDEG
jgi:hypothetical protein